MVYNYEFRKSMVERIDQKYNRIYKTCIVLGMSKKEQQDLLSTLEIKKQTELQRIDNLKNNIEALGNKQDIFNV